MKATNKIINDSALVLSFVAVLVTGVMLHLKSHGIIIEPRPVLKTIHFIIGFAMILFAAIHVSNYFRILKNLRPKFPFSAANTYVLLVAFAAVVLTGLVKLLSPVKIPHLGLWHYWFGLIMSASAIAHLLRFLPWLLRKLK